MISEPRRPFVAGNWKMHLTEPAARALIGPLADASAGLPRVRIGVAPAFPMLRVALDLAAGSSLVVGAQNVHSEDAGAFTGEVSAPMLCSMGIAFVIVGHSERRVIFGETDAVVAAKIPAVVRNGMTPLVCVGESEKERDAGRTLEVVERQLRAACSSLEAAAARAVVVAYEPVWAIGTGRVPTPEQIVEVHSAIRRACADLWSERVAEEMPILYGGSVNDRNARDILGLADVDGALVGGASLDADRFLTIARAAAELPDRR